MRDCLTHFWIAHKFRIRQSVIAVSQEVNISHEQLCSVFSRFWVLHGKWLQILYDPEADLIWLVAACKWFIRCQLISFIWTAAFLFFCTPFLQALWSTDCLHLRTMLSASAIVGQPIKINVIDHFWLVWPLCACVVDMPAFRCMFYYVWLGWMGLFAYNKLKL